MPENTQAVSWRSAFPEPMVVIAGTALAVLVPMLFLGLPSGHDFEFHVNSWMEVVNQWKEGIVYPRWASAANYGFGEARFIFYPPLSWLLGALLGLSLPWALVSAAYAWIAMVAAGFSMFFLAHRFLPPRDATFAAALYAVNPYHLVIVYWRSAFAELLASSLVPMLALLVWKAAEDERPITIPLALVLAAAWLTNAPAALMIHYSLALLILFFVWSKKSPGILWTAGIAMAVGAGLAAFYLLPAIYEQRWVEIANAVSAGSRPADNFLFVRTTDA